MLEKLKEIFDPKNQKKNTSNLILLLFAGAVVLLLSNFFLRDNNNSNLTTKVTDTNQTEKYITASTEEDYVSNMERKLEEILMKIKGVGEVHVMITIDDTSEKIPVFNT